MRYIDGELRFSPSDLTQFLESEYASWMERWWLEIDQNRAGIPENRRPNEDDEELAIIAARGNEHETQFLNNLREEGRNITSIAAGADSVERTRQALAKGPEVIYQAHLVDGNLGGYADFLIRVPGKSDLGDYHYEVWDTKLAKSAKPHFVIQLCAYADLLERAQGRRPTGFEVVLGTKKRIRFETEEYFHYYRALLESFLAFQNAFDLEREPHPGDYSNHGHWSNYAESVLESEDHLSKVANITTVQIRKLNAAGITTLESLAKTPIEHVPRLAPETFEKLKRQARLQFESTGKERPCYEVLPNGLEVPQGLELLPAASRRDVYFDMEGFPLYEGGLEYLFGAAVVENGKPEFKDWWAHDKCQEKQAFENFVDWVHARWQADRSMHIYHYAAYEVATLKRLSGQFASREEKVDDLLRNQVFVDLYAVVRQGLVMGTPSYSLKDVERVYMGDREGQVVTAGGSIVAYHNWLTSGESEDWRQSPILREIRDYNEVDCISTWKLAEWLRRVQIDSGITVVPRNAELNGGNEEGEANGEHPNQRASDLAQQMQNELKAANPDDQGSKIKQLLAWLLEFHWREARPVFWRKHAMHELTEAELIDDFDCLGGLRRTERPRQQIKRSFAFEYSFDADQETKLHQGSKCFFAHDLTSRTEIVRFDADEGKLEIKLGPRAEDPPQTLGLIPDEYVSAQVIADAVYRYVASWNEGTILPQAVDDLLHKRSPRIRGQAAGNLIQNNQPLLESTIEVVSRMDNTLLCVQGPPGTGKTYTAASAIVKLLRQGKKIAVTANNHKAIVNVLKKTRELMRNAGDNFEIHKVGGDPKEPAIEQFGLRYVGQSSAVAGLLGDGPLVVGGTAWVFSRPELEQKFDYLFVDEAGQFSLANVVATGCCAKNIVLVGDQMQLSQPTLGAHPGNSGVSALDYFLDGRPTIPEDRGILLDQSWRMHPNICRFVSDALYESRLNSHPDTQPQRICRANQGPTAIEAGIEFIPVEHEGNRQSSLEEVEQIKRLIESLVGRPYLDFAGAQRERLGIEDILVVAPFNMQVRLLKQHLGNEARAGTVDKFQGQEAPVVIVSLGSSSIEESPRGAHFLLDPNRLNVAVSRAKTLALVVASPAIAVAKCRSIEEMKLANLFCRLVDYARSINHTAE
jgi:predicted RecB family nuclease